MITKLDFLKPLMKSQKGDSEAFESFRLLIGFVLATAVLTIIIVMISKIHNSSILISSQKFEEGVVSASKSPGVSSKVPFVIEDLMLSGTISKRKMAYLTGYPEECISFEIGPGIEENKKNKDVTITKKYIKTDVYVYCDFMNDENPAPFPDILNAFEPACSVAYCAIFINKTPSPTLYQGIE